MNDPNADRSDNDDLEVYWSESRIQQEILHGNHEQAIKLQKQLLEYDEEEQSRQAIANYNLQNVFSGNMGGNGGTLGSITIMGTSATTGNANISNSTGKQKALPKVDEFCAWSQFPKAKPKKSDKVKSIKEKEINVWRDYRPKEINFVFKHYDDWRQYIQQYRHEHTYNFGPLSKETIDHIGVLSLRPQQHPPRLKSEYTQNNYANPARTTQRVQSESNILELAHRYKLSPTLLRHDSTNSLESDNGYPQPHTTSINCKYQGRTGSGKSVRSNSANSGRGGINLMPNKVPSIPRASKMETPANGAPNAFLGKKQMPYNGYAIDSCGLGKKTAPVGGLLLPAGNTMRTLDLLSHVNSVDRQIRSRKMWFDASGRAYVSLAARYDPIRK